MKPRLPITVILGMTLLSFGTALAQEHDHAAPYADLATREIKALSPEDVDGLIRGAGMGMALPAELNGFPGPKHVLELASELELTDDQLADVRRIFDTMDSEARAVGARIVDLERDLDGAFASGSVDTEYLERAVGEIGALRARLRFAHLKAHLEVTPLLTEHQKMRYRHARGYGGHH